MTGFRNSFSYGRSLPSNNEAEYYADPAVGPNPFAVQNGALTITARPTKPGEQAGGLPYTSGMITTENSFAQNQGYFEIRAQTPSTKGFWSAFWMLPEGGAGNPELDVLEQPNNLGSSSYWTYANFGDANKGGGTNDTGQELSAGYHRYGLMWTPTAITYYFDGQQVGQSFPPPAGYASKMFLIANLAVGGAGSWPGQPVGTPTAEYKIDYIRAFSLDPAVSTVAMQAISSPDGVDTRPILTAAPTPTPQGPIGSGPDTLTLNMAEDAYQGNAQTVTDTTPVILEVVAPPVVVTPPPVVPPIVVPPAPVAPNFAVSNQTTGAQSVATGNAYTGPVGGLARELILITPDNLAVVSFTPNVFIHTGSGTDAINVWAGGGNNVVDGGEGSNYLVGGVGRDTFFLDARGDVSKPIWDTVRNLGSGDAATLWGVTPQNFALNWQDNQGAAGATGLTLHATRAGGATVSLTLSGYATNDLTNGRLALNFGENAGGKYLYVAAT